MTNSEADLIRKYVLINATEHAGQAQTKSVLGKLLADQPDLRARALELRPIIEDTVEDVNRLGLARQKSELDKLGGYQPIKHQERKGLPEMERGDKFVVRFAPNPDGALHLGNARPAVLCDEYAKKYKGKLILRFDDTDPKIKVPEKKFYKWIKDDLKWLGIKWHGEYVASKRLNIYYKYAETMIKSSSAYVCTCGDEWKVLRDKSKACPCRSLDSRNQLRRWKRMFKGFKEGEAVLRIKTDLEAKNPAVRDWPAFRIVDAPKHPLVKKKLWPLYNFASAIDDHLLGVTHIFRGQEHSTNEVKQRFLYQHLRWEYPQVITLGRFSLSGMVLSKSQIREGIERHIYNDWDDLRLGTLRSLNRRGFQPEALRQIIIEIGPKPSDLTVSMENLAAYNRKLIDKIANRYFFISDPKRIEVKGLKLKQIKIPLHPEAKRGFRSISIGKTFYIDTKDFENCKGLEVRLKDLCNVKLGERSEFTGFEVKPTPKIQWVSEKHLQVKVITPEIEIKGYGETGIAKEKPGSILQFERFGFVKIEKSGGNIVTAIWSHE